MRQGEIWNVYFDPVEGNEHAGNRPAIIISGNLMNTKAELVIVCPITSSIKNYLGNPIIEPNVENGLTLISEILVFQIRTLSKERFKKRIGKISKTEIEKIKTTLDEILRL